MSALSFRVQIVGDIGRHSIDLCGVTATKDERDVELSPDAAYRVWDAIRTLSAVWPSGPRGRAQIMPTERIDPDFPRTTLRDAIRFEHVGDGEWSADEGDGATHD